MKLQILLITAALGLFTSCNAQERLPVGETVTQFSKSIFIVFQDSKNNYWFGSDENGVYRYNGKIITHYTTLHGLAHNRIHEIQEDAAGNIYFTTVGGINKFDGKTITTLVPLQTNDWKLQPGDLWFKGEPGKNGPYRYDGKVLHSLQFPKHFMHDQFVGKGPKGPYSPYELYYMYKDKRGHIWFGTSNLGVCRYDGNTLSWLYEDHLTNVAGGGSFGIRSIMEDAAGQFWFCNTRYRYTIYPGDSVANGYHFIRYKKEPGISLTAPDGSDLIYFMSIIEDANRELWMATYRWGVWRYNTKTVTRYAVKDGAKDINIFSVYKDRQGQLWLGTHYAGPYKFNGRTFEPFEPAR